MRHVARLGELHDPLGDEAYAAQSWRGIGSALIDAALDAARAAGYQRRGFRLAELRAGAVDVSRSTIKPSIPEIGDHGIPLHDELVLERRL